MSCPHLSGEDRRDAAVTHLAVLGVKKQEPAFWLSAANFWDLVPYSFVIDWFLPIGDVLAACDSMLQGRYIYTDVYYSTSYIEDREHGVTDGRKARSHLHYHFCVRFVGQGLEHIDPWSLASSCDQNFTVSQQAQGSALIIQRALPGKR